MRVRYVATLLATLLISSVGRADDVPKIAALLAIDSDLSTREAASIKKTGEVAASIVQTFCGKKDNHKYRSTAKGQKILSMNRAPSDGKPAVKPNDLIKAIEELETTANDIIFIYACCHGGYHGEDHYLFLTTNDEDVVTGLKRADVVAALRKKQYHSVLFLTDACSNAVKGDAPPVADLGQDDQLGRLNRILGSLKKGTFLDVNTSMKGEFSAIDHNGGVATVALQRTLEDDPKSWIDLHKGWQKKTTSIFQRVRGQTLANSTLSDSGVKKKYMDQRGQSLDVKAHAPLANANAPVANVVIDGPVALEKYTIEGGGSFTRIGKTEWVAKSEDGKEYKVEEVKRENEGFIILYQASQKRYYSLPLSGGSLYTRLDSESSWTTLPLKVKKE